MYMYLKCSLLILEPVLYSTFVFYRKNVQDESQSDVQSKRLKPEANSIPKEDDSAVSMDISSVNVTNIEQNQNQINTHSQSPISSPPQATPHQPLINENGFMSARKGTPVKRTPVKSLTLSKNRKTRTSPYKTHIGTRPDTEDPLPVPADLEGGPDDSEMMCSSKPVNDNNNGFISARRRPAVVIKKEQQVLKIWLYSTCLIYTYAFV